MAKKIKRAQQRAAKRAAKAARYAARVDPRDSNSKFAERHKARLRGEPMASRSHEGRPYWEFSVHGQPLSKVMGEMAAKATARSSEPDLRRAA